MSTSSPKDHDCRKESAESDITSEKIKFRCESKNRKNVSKYLIRKLLKKYNADEFKEKYNVYGIEIDTNIHSIFQHIKEIERGKGSVMNSIITKKDYKKLIKNFLNKKNFRIMLKCLL